VTARLENHCQKSESILRFDANRAGGGARFDFARGAENHTVNRFALTFRGELIDCDISSDTLSCVPFQTQIRFLKNLSIHDGAAFRHFTFRQRPRFRRKLRRLSQR